jgi:Trp operon repressor
MTIRIDATEVRNLPSLRKRAAIVAELATGHGTYRELAARHGTSISMVHRLAKRAGMKRPTGRRLAADKRTGILADLQQRDYSRKEIAARHGVNVVTVWRVAKQAGISLRCRPRWPAWAIKRSKELGAV